jgi:hypothetical protein
LKNAFFSKLKNAVFSKLKNAFNKKFFSKQSLLRPLECLRMLADFGGAFWRDALCFVLLEIL